MSIPLAVSQLAEIEASRKEGALDPASTLAISMSRVGGGARQKIVAGTLLQLGEQDPSVYGEPLHSLVIVGKRLHPLEVEYASIFAVDKTWTKVARDVYGVAVN
jgi:diphthine synthase